MWLVWVVESENPLSMKCVNLATKRVKIDEHNPYVLCFEDADGNGECYRRWRWFTSHALAQQWFDTTKRAQLAILNEQIAQLEALEFPQAPS